MPPWHAAARLMGPYCNGEPRIAGPLSPICTIHARSATPLPSTGLDDFKTAADPPGSAPSGGCSAPWCLRPAKHHAKQSKAAWKTRGWAWGAPHGGSARSSHALDAEMPEMKDVARCSVMGSTWSGTNGRNVMSFMSRRPTVADGRRGLGPGSRPSHLRSDSMPSRSSSGTQRK